jgi:predicted RND superfamily exporter protein
LSKYISAKREGAAPIEAVRYSIDKAGSAITITTLSLAVGTFLLVFSSTSIFQNVALLITPIIVTALFLDLLFLPPLLMRFDAWLDRIRGVKRNDVSQRSPTRSALETAKI